MRRAFINRAKYLDYTRSWIFKYSDEPFILYFIKVSFHKFARNHLLLVYPREVYIVDLELGQTIGCVGGGGNNSISNDAISDRSTTSGGLSPIIQAYPCSQRDAIYLLHENGTVSLRTRRGIFTKAAVPRTAGSGLPRSISLNSSIMSSSGDANTIRENLRGQPVDSRQNVGTLRDDLFLEITYELKGMTCDSAIKQGGGAKAAKVKPKNYLYGRDKDWN